MKKAICAAVFLSMAMAAHGQLYLRAGVGYAIPAAGQSISGEGLPYNGAAPTATGFNIKGASFAAGVQALGGIGYMINKNVGVQLDVSAGVAPKEYTYAISNVSVSGVASNVTFKNKAASPVMMMPALVLQSGGNVWNIYTRLGLALPLNTTINQDRIFANLPGTGAATVQDELWKLSSSFALGYSAAAGVAYKVNDRMSIWGEISVLSLSVYLKEEYFSEVTVNGQAINLGGYNITRTIYYSKSGNTDTNGVHNPTYSQPFSNVGFTFGVKYNLSAPPRRKQAAKRNEEFE